MKMIRRIKVVEISEGKFVFPPDLFATLLPINNKCKHTLVSCQKAQ